MKFFVTGVNGQLGHDVMNELSKRCYEAVGSDIQECCSAEMPYISIDITDEKAVYNAIEGNDWSSYLTRAYTYGTLNENSMKNLASIDFSVKNMPEYIAGSMHNPSFATS